MENVKKESIISCDKCKHRLTNISPIEGSPCLTCYLIVSYFTEKPSYWEKIKRFFSIG